MLVVIVVPEPEPVWLKAPALSSRFFCFCLFNLAELLVVFAGSSSDALLSSFASLFTKGGPAGDFAFAAIVTKGGSHAAGDFAFAAIVTKGRPAEGDLAQRSRIHSSS